MAGCPMRWDRSSVEAACVLDVVITRLLWSVIMITESQSCLFAAISVFLVTAFPSKPQTILFTSADWSSAHSYRMWDLPQQKKDLPENLVKLKPLSLFYRSC